MKNILNKTNLLVIGGLLLLTVIVAVVMNFANDTTTAVDSEASGKGKSESVVAKEKDSNKEKEKADKEKEKAVDEEAVKEAENTEVTVPEGEKATQIKVDASKPGNNNSSNQTAPSTQTPWPSGGTQQNPIELEIVEVEVE